jgi:hypothetical protein
MWNLDRDHLLWNLDRDFVHGINVPSSMDALLGRLQKDPNSPAHMTSADNFGSMPCPLAVEPPLRL